MATGSVDTDRAVSEFAGVAILITMTVLVTASVGVFVLVSDTEKATGPPDANFSFQYFSDSSMLLITFERGEKLPAGNITVRSRSASATWATLAGTNESELVGPGAAVQISNRNAFGQPISRDERIRIVYHGVNGTQYQLDSWNED